MPVSRADSGASRPANPANSRAKPGSGVEAERELAQQPCEAFAVGAREHAQQHGLGIDEARDRGIHPRLAVVGQGHQHAAAVGGVGLPPHEPAPDEAIDALKNAPGVVVTEHPNPLEATGRDEVFVGRIRQDQSVDGDKGLVLFVVGDNLRKGAALNAVQVAEELVKRRG